MPGSHDTAQAASSAVQMSFIIDTGLLTMLERKQVPSKLKNWILHNEAEIFLSVVSLAEMQFGLHRAPETQMASIGAWLADLQQKLAPSTEELTEAVLVRWKELLADFTDTNRMMTCEDSLIAATALFRSHTVATRNTRHFEPAGVQTVDPLAQSMRPFCSPTPRPV